MLGRVLGLTTALVLLLSACGEESLVFVMSIAVAPISGDLPAYDRDEWRHWIDEDGDCQDTRQEALVAESISAVEYTGSDQCRVASGEWIDPYTGERFAGPSDLEIDHLVPLANTHASGGWAWSESRKRAYANDLSFAGHLVAVHGPANQAKGKSGPEDWQPPERAYWCQYAIDWITVKNSWELTATEVEVAALAELLDTCEPRRILEGLEPEARSTPTATSAAVGDGAYATCDEAEAAGELRTQGSEGGGWGFPQSVVPDARDGDGDGIVCEETLRSATSTPSPVVSTTTETPPTATAAPANVADGAYASCEGAETAREERIQGNEGDGWGFPQSVVPSARDGDRDGVVCEETIPSATPTSGPDPAATPTPRPVTSPTTEAPPTATGTEGVYDSCDDAEAAGEERVRGSSGNGRGFPQSMVPSARDGDSDGVVCEVTVRSATPTPRPVTSPTTEAPPTATGTEGVYDSCDDAEAAGEERVRGSSGNGRGFPQSMVPSARDGDSDGVVCEVTVRSATSTPRPVASPTTEPPPTATGAEGVYDSCDDAEAAGEQRVQGSNGNGHGFPQSMVPSARDGDSDGVVCEVTRSATSTPRPVASPTLEAPPTSTGAEGVYDSCDDAEAAGEQRVQGSNGNGHGFPQSMVPSARDGDSDGVVCEVTVRNATPTPRPVASPTLEAPPTATGTERIYASCDEAEAAGEQRMQGSKGSGWGFPQSMVPSARDGDSDGVVCEVTVRSATPTPRPVASPTTEAPPTATGTERVYASCDEAEAAGEQRMQGSKGSGWGFPQSMVPSARDGDSDGVVCEVTIRSATSTPRPVATATLEAPPTATGTERVYDSCNDAEAAGEQRVQGSNGNGRGFPQSMVPDARDGDSDGVVCER